MAPIKMIQEQESYFEDQVPVDLEACYIPTSETNRSRLDARRRLEQLQELKRLRLDIDGDFLEEL